MPDPHSNASAATASPLKHVRRRHPRRICAETVGAHAPPVSRLYRGLPAPWRPVDLRQKKFPTPCAFYPGASPPVRTRPAHFPRPPGAPWRRRQTSFQRILHSAPARRRRCATRAGVGQLSDRLDEAVIMRPSVGAEATRRGTKPPGNLTS
jgi:hypothetical protein